MNVKVIKGAKSVEVIHMPKANAKGMHKTTPDGNVVLAKFSNAVIEKIGGLDKAIKVATRLNPKLKITVEDASAPAPAPEPAPAPAPEPAPAPAPEPAPAPNG